MSLFPCPFAVELNLAGMAGHAEDRYDSGLAGGKLGLLDSRTDLAHGEDLSLTYEWLGLAAGLAWSRPGGL